MRVVEFLRHERASIRHVAHDLEYDAAVQWRFHRRMTWFWFGMFAPVIGMGTGAVIDRHHAVLWAAALLIFNLIMSCYANFATELDAVAASYSAMKAEEAARNTRAES